MQRGMAVMMETPIRNAEPAQLAGHYVKRGDIGPNFAPIIAEEQVNRLAGNAFQDKGIMRKPLENFYNVGYMHDEAGTVDKLRLEDPNFGLTFDDAKVHYNLDLIDFDNMGADNVGPLSQMSPRATRRMGINAQKYTLYRTPDGRMLLWNEVKR